ncbi:cupin domain-containing protein [Nocardia sp. alder85J]|uniref:cupin domain-containing protein n=1 Tax=Nocardia sp. alder85J TaxID=2862949 RepID=UPI001CD4CC3F|nr:cupin domain-containing protein [Nocardia sp. alder85J]MCX4091979.1 cupin domain-containing protein [Nocardia sp. alder85J]
MLVFDLDNEPWAEEHSFNTLSRRLFPWHDLREINWGGSWVKVRPGETTTPHAHDEKEMYFVVEGTGYFTHGAERVEARPGTTAIMTPGVHHSLTNTGPGDLLFLAVWWTDDQHVHDPALPS